MTNPTVHLFGPSFSNFVRTIMLICEEKHIPYTVGFTVDGEKVAYKSEQHYKLHPFGKFPVLIQDDFYLPETASICRYLDNNFTGKKLQSENQLTFAQQDALCALISIDVDKALVRDYLLEFSFPKGEDGSVRFDVVEKAKPQVNKALAFINDQLEQGILSPESGLTIADALLLPMLHYIENLPDDYNLLTAFPKVESYLATFMTTASCQKILIIKK